MLLARAQTPHQTQPRTTLCTFAEADGLHHPGTYVLVTSRTGLPKRGTASTDYPGQYEMRLLSPAGVTIFCLYTQLAASLPTWDSINHRPNGYFGINKRSDSPVVASSSSPGPGSHKHQTAERLYKESVKKGEKMYKIMYDPKAKQSDFKKPEDLEKWGWTGLDNKMKSKAEIDEVLHLLDAPLEKIGFDTTEISNVRIQMRHSMDTKHAMKKYPAIPGAKYDNVFNPTQGALFAFRNYGPADKQSENPKLRGKKLRKLKQWSDVVYLALEKLTTAEQRQKMRYLFRTQIHSPTMEPVVEHALQIVGAKETDWPGHTFHEKDAREPFLALLGTPHGKGLVWLLSQHRGEDQLGFKAVTSITVWRTPRKETGLDINPNLHMLFEFQSVGKESTKRSSWVDTHKSGLEARNSNLTMTISNDLDQTNATLNRRDSVLDLALD